MSENRFAPVKRPVKASKQRSIGRELVGRIYERDLNKGASFTEVTGAPGAGKTSVMLSFGNYIIKRKNELVYWSSSFGAPLQFFPLNKYHILCKTGMDIHFWDRYKNEEIELPHTNFKTFDELYEQSKFGVLNCPFFGDRTQLMEFIEFLMSKGGWHTILIDEISEIVPSFTSGNMFKRIGYFANHTLGQARKCGITIVCNTQATTDTDHRIRKKLNNRIYLPGARVDKRASRVFQKAVDNLDENHTRGSQAYICAGGRFGVVRFTDIYTPVKNMSIEARTSYRSIENYGIETTEQATDQINSRRCSERPTFAHELGKFKDYRNTLLNQP